jgi:hypothetical protein
MTTTRALTALLAATAFLAGAACSQVKPKTSDDRRTDALGGDGNEAGPDGAAPGAAAEDGDPLARLEVLSPGELGSKIYQLFGPKMTEYQENGRTVDYLDNGSNFTGAISADPNNRIASAATPSYFLALASLSDIVGNNYATQFYSKTAKYDCTKDADIKAMVEVITGSSDQAELDAIGADLKAACQAKPRDAIKAIVQSLTFVVKNIH